MADQDKAALQLSEADLDQLCKEFGLEQLDPSNPSFPWHGFRDLRAGRIHIYCPQCGRRGSNMHRGPYDPPMAEVAHILCEKCDRGNKDGGVQYLDARGKWMGCVDPLGDGE